MSTTNAKQRLWEIKEIHLQIRHATGRFPNPDLKRKGEVFLAVHGARAYYDMIDEVMQTGIDLVEENKKLKEDTQKMYRALKALDISQEECQECACCKQKDFHYSDCTLEEALQSLSNIYEGK